VSISGESRGSINRIVGRLELTFSSFADSSKPLVTSPSRPEDLACFVSTFSQGALEGSEIGLTLVHTVLIHAFYDIFHLTWPIRSGYTSSDNKNRTLQSGPPCSFELDFSLFFQLGDVLCLIPILFLDPTLDLAVSRQLLRPSRSRSADVGSDPGVKQPEGMRLTSEGGFRWERDFQLEVVLQYPSRSSSVKHYRRSLKRSSP
jgi:hypothetical protein